MVKHVLSEIPAKEYIISDERKAELDAMYSPEAEIARLQEQVERLEADLRDYRNGMDSARKDFFTATTKLVASEARAEAAEAERDRLRELLHLVGMSAGYQYMTMETRALIDAALQKEPQP